MDYISFARDIIRYVGGVDNIESVFHCVTRLRFVLIDHSKILEKEMRTDERIIGIHNSNIQFQLIIGDYVDDLFIVFEEEKERREYYMKDYRQMASKIIDGVGGISNIEDAIHCVTRLRFTLKDDTKANANKVKSVDGVMDVQNHGGQYQVIIGTDVEKVYHEVHNKLGNKADSGNQEPTKKGNQINKVLDIFSSIIVKPMYAIAGAGILRGFLFMFVSLGWLDSSSSTYIFLNMIGDCTMYFMPFMLAVSAAKKFKTNEYLAMAIACVMFAPTYVATLSSGAETTLSIFGLVVPTANYGSSIIPIIVAVWLMSHINRFLEKVVPKVLGLFITPLLVLLIMVPLTMLAIGPLGVWLGDGLAEVLQILFDKAPWVAGIIIGGVRPLLVIVGMHHAIRPITYQQLATYGYNLISPLNFISTMAQATSCFACYFITKNKEEKALALSSAASGYLGITEPALYGVILKLQRPLIATVIGGGIGGAYVAMMGVSSTTHAMSSVFTIPIFFGEKFIHLLIGLGISTVITFVLTIILGASDSYRREEAEKLKQEDRIQTKEIFADGKIKIVSPVKGTLIPLENVDDVAFSKKEMGDGVGIIPTDGKIFASCDGKIKMIFATKHAIGIETKEGAEILMHVGINTVNLNGEGFKCFVEEGQMVNKGDLLLEVDLQYLEDQQVDPTVVLLVTNLNKFQIYFMIDKARQVKVGDEVMYVTNAGN